MQGPWRLEQDSLGQAEFPTCPAFLCSGIGLFLLACNEGSRTPEVEKGPEEARLSSPNGQLDAVMIREDAGGAAGGWEWYVYIVGKGKPVLKSAHAILYAGTLRGESLVWAQEHLLDIRYDIANIHEFRNLWGLSEVQDVGSTGERDYLVEIRLVPSSQGFSLLTF